MLARRSSQENSARANANTFGPGGWSPQLEPGLTVSDGPGSDPPFGAAGHPAA